MHTSCINSLCNDSDGGVIIVEDTTPYTSKWSVASSRLDGPAEFVSVMSDYAYDEQIYVDAFRFRGDIYLNHHDRLSSITTLATQATRIGYEIPEEVQLLQAQVMSDNLAYIGITDRIINRDIPCMCYKLADYDVWGVDEQGGDGVIDNTIYSYQSIYKCVFARDIRMEAPFSIRTASGTSYLSFVMANNTIVSISTFDGPDTPVTMYAIDLRMPDQFYELPLPAEYAPYGLRLKCELVTYW